MGRKISDLHSMPSNDILSQEYAILCPCGTISPGFRNDVFYISRTEKLKGVMDSTLKENVSKRHDKDAVLLDTTLRDGSYTNNFSFTKDDTRAIVSALDEAGFQFIEVGHGVGLNASNSGKGEAVHTDLEYISTAVNAAKNAKIGVFCIPGIARICDVEAARAAGLSFIRIGVNATDVERGMPYIKRARDLGLMVFVNYMKSYAVSPKFFASLVVKTEDYGAHCAYIVDSAGGMFPEQIQTYCEEIRKHSNIPLGFHGHNNLSLAVSNTLCAYDAGVKYLDVSLQGLGRSAGNTASEQLVAVLNKKFGYDKIDLMKLIEISQRYIIPLKLNQIIPPLDVIAGFANFHSSYMRTIQRAAAKYSANPLLLIIEWCKVDQVNLDVAKLEKIAKKLADTAPMLSENFNFSRYYGNEQN